MEKEHSISRALAVDGCQHHALKTFIHVLHDLFLSHVNKVKHSKAIVGFKQQECTLS